MKQFLLFLQILLFSATTLISQNWELLKDVGSNGEDQQHRVHVRGHQLDVDADGNIYLAGKFGNGTLIAGLGMPPLEELRAVNNYFVSKYSPQGVLLWASPIYSDLDFVTGGIGVVASHDINSLYVDDKKNVYVTGSYKWQVLSAECLSDTEDFETVHMYYAKFNALGECQYLRTGITGDGGRCMDIIKASDDKLYVTGQFRGFVQFVDITITGTSVPEQRITESFIAEIDENGRIHQHKTMRSSPGNSRCVVLKMLLDHEQNLVLAGLCNGRILFDNQWMSGQNDAELFVMKLTPELEPLLPEEWKYAETVNGGIFDIKDLHAMGEDKYALSGFFIADELVINNLRLPSEDGGDFGKFHHFLTTFDFNGDPGILITTASLLNNGGPNSAVQSCTDSENIYVLTSILDSGIVADRVIHTSIPNTFVQYLAVINPETGICVYLEELDKGKSVGIESFDNKIVISGEFVNSFQLENKKVTAPQGYWDIYFAVKDLGTVGTQGLEVDARHLPYPNPAHDMLYLNTITYDHLTIRNIHGYVMKHLHSKVQEIDISNFVPGVYCITTTYNGTFNSYKFVKN